MLRANTENGWASLRPDASPCWHHSEIEPTFAPVCGNPPRCGGWYWKRPGLATGCDTGHGVEIVFPIQTLRQLENAVLTQRSMVRTAYGSGPVLIASIEAVG